MTTQKGKDLLLKIDTDGMGSFTTVAGLRARAISFGADVVDATDSESAGRWRELLAGCGAKKARISGSGLFRDQASDAAVRTSFFDGSLLDWQIILPDFGTVEGPFQIVTLEYAGDHDDAMTFDMTLESAGALAFTAA